MPCAGVLAKFRPHKASCRARRGHSGGNSRREQPDKAACVSRLVAGFFMGEAKV